MVFFSCNACGDSVKKNQVENHWQLKCRSCTVLSCLDCGKDFPGDSYKEHFTCITEAEKYSGKDFKPKPVSNKGEQKQNLWLQQVQAAIGKASANPQLTTLLKKIEEYPNIPRKKAKFENFLKNSLRVYGCLATQAWDMINAELPQKVDEPENSNKPAEKESQDENETNKLKAIENQAETDGNKQVKKNKKEKKEERKKKQTKSEKKDKHVTNESEECKTDKKGSKKHKKKGKADLINSAEVNGNNIIEVDKTEKKKRKHKIETEEVEEQEGPELKRSRTTEDKEVAEGRLNDTLVDESPSHSPFKWRSAITRALESAPENMLPLKKLQKKVFAEYNIKDSSKKPTSKDQLIGKFMKKLNASSNIKVHKEKVQLISSDPDN